MGDTIKDERLDISEEIVSLYISINTAEQNFNEIQSSYRRLASVWLLATFSAVGYILTNSLSLSIDENMLIGLILLSGGIGNLLIWLVDLLFYQRLLHSHFKEGLSLETAYKLPKIRHKMISVLDGKGASFKLYLFYAIPASVMIASGAYPLIKSCIFKYVTQVYSATLAALASILILVLTFELIRRRSSIKVV